MLALKSLNAQLLNEADPLVLSTGRARINWPRSPDLQPEAVLAAPKDAPGSTASRTSEVIPAPSLE